MSKERKIRTLYELGIVFFLFLVLTFVITFPLGVHLSSYLAPSDDTYANIWYFWWFKHALVELGQWPLFTQFLYFPPGTTLNFETSWIHDLMIFPFIICCGTITAFNLLIFINFGLTGTGFYLFLKELTKEWWPSFLGAFVFTFSAFRLYKIQAGHIDLLSTEWVGFYLFFLFRWAQVQKPLYGLLAVIFLSLIAYTEYRIFIFILLMSWPLFIFFLWARSFPYRLKLTALFMFVFAVFISVIPLLILHQKYLFTVQKINTRDIIEKNLTPDLAQFFSPNFTKIGLPKFYDQKLAHSENEAVYLGIIPLLLALIGLCVGRDHQQERALKYLIITFGPTPLFLGTELMPSTLWPYNLFLQVPILNFLRVPGRFIVVVHIGLAILAAYGLKYLLSQRFRRQSTIVVGLCFLLLFSEKLLTPFTFEKPYVPALYESLAKEDAQYSILELPLGFLDGMYKPVGTFDPRVLFRQTVHQKYLLTGYLSLTPPHVWDTATSDSTLLKIIACQDNSHCVNFTPEEKSRLINHFRVRYVVFLPSTSQQRLIDFFKSNLDHVSLVSQDDTSFIYRLD